MKHFLFAALVLILPLTSQALVEARLGYGIHTFDDSYNGLDLKSGNAINLDVIFEPPMITDLGLGLRYETLGFDFEAGGTAVSEGKLERIAALINYRIIDLIAYFGVIGTVGISNTFETETGGTTNTNYDEKLNFTLGLEGGVNLGIFSVGGEVGKLFASVENPGSSDISLDGTYVKVLVGLDF